jgi:DNA-directed RNA polymerase specialized sigma24 family protein
VVVLRYWYDQSIEEIARTTGDSVGAAKVKLHRARNALAREMSRAANHMQSSARIVRAAEGVSNHA